MARPAPAVDRTVMLLNFLASRPGETFSLSELSRRLDLNKATAHAMLTALVEAGYLLRHPVEKSYSLGPALIAVGSAAARQFAPVDYAAGEMRRIADDLGVQCVASAVVSGEIVMLACAGQPRPLGTSVSPGQRLSLTPPLGTVYMAWASPPEIDAWLHKLGPDVTREEMDRFRGALAAVRSRGYATGLEAVAKLQLSKALSEVPKGGQLDRRRLRTIVEGLVEELAHEEDVLGDLAGAAHYQLSHLSAPVFGADGHVALALNLIDLPRGLDAATVARFAERLVGAARRVTKAIGGHAPDDSYARDDAVGSGVAGSDVAHRVPV